MIETSEGTNKKALHLYSLSLISSSCDYIMHITDKANISKSVGPVARYTCIAHSTISATEILSTHYILMSNVKSVYT